MALNMQIDLLLLANKYYWRGFPAIPHFLLFVVRWNLFPDQSQPWSRAGRVHRPHLCLCQRCSCGHAHCGICWDCNRYDACNYIFFFIENYMMICSSTVRTMSLKTPNILSDFSHLGKWSRHGGQNKWYPYHRNHHCHLPVGYLHGWHGLGVKG